MDFVTHFHDLHTGAPEHPERFVRIDRKTIWGNHSVFSGRKPQSGFLSPAQRCECVLRYEAELVHDSLRLSRLEEFNHKGIACHCDIAVQACHGEALLRTARRVGAITYPLLLDRSLLNVPYGIIAHQVNCRGAMGAGVALAIRNKWPDVFRAYSSYKLKTGNIQFVKVSDNPILYVCNLAGQNAYGKDVQKTDYDAVDEAMIKLAAASRKTGFPVYVPRLMGCGLAGGNWDVYLPILTKHLPEISVCAPRSRNPELYHEPKEETSPRISGLSCS